MHPTDAWLAGVLGLATLGQLTFVLSYLTLPWWNSALGRFLFFTAVVVLLVLSSASAGLMWDWPHEYEIRLGIYAMLDIALWGQAFFFIALARKRETP